MKKVLMVQPILSHYRQSLFELLVSDSKVDFIIIAGNELNGVKTFKTNSEKIKANLKNRKFSFKGRNFYYQQGLFKAIKEEKPTNIIFGGPDFHFISTIIVSLYVIFFTKIKVHYWTHGISKSNYALTNKSLIFFYKKATSILTYENNGKEAIAKIVEKEKIYVVKNCLNERDYGFNNKNDTTNRKSNKIIILFSGRLTKNKRVDLLIKATEVLIKEKFLVHCNIIGEGENKNELEVLTNKLGLDKFISFKGGLYGKEVEPFFQSSDIFVLPGKVGLSIVHALSYGLPIVTTSLPIHSPEVAILKQDKNAFFFKGDSSDSLAATLKICVNLLSKDNNELSYNCIKSVKENGYIPERMKINFFNAIEV